MLMQPWNIEVLAEVAQWRAGLRTPHRAKVDAAIDLLAERGELLPYPYSSHLVGKLRELRIQFGGEGPGVVLPGEAPAHCASHRVPQAAAARVGGDRTGTAGHGSP
jgi:hypothetical protein